MKVESVSLETPGLGLRKEGERDFPKAHVECFKTTKWITHSRRKNTNVCYTFIDHKKAVASLTGSGQAV